MKTLFPLIYILISFQIVFGQDTKSPIYFNEFEASINRMMLKSDNITNHFGFGIGIYRSNFDTHKINLLFGLEYNMTSLKIKDLMMGSHFSAMKDVSYTMHWLSIPIDVRYNIGNKVKLFVQLGVFIDMPIYSIAKGFLINYYPEPGSNYPDEKIERHNVVDGPDYGFVSAIGIKIPVSKHEIIIKPAYRFGIRKLDYNFNDRYLKLSIGFKI